MKLKRYYCANCMSVFVEYENVKVSRCYICKNDGYLIELTDEESVAIFTWLARRVYGKTDV